MSVSVYLFVLTEQFSHIGANGCLCSHWRNSSVWLQPSHNEFPHNCKFLIQLVKSCMFVCLQHQMFQCYLVLIIQTNVQYQYWYYSCITSTVYAVYLFIYLKAQVLVTSVDIH